MAKRYIPIANYILMDTRLYPSSLRVLVAMHALKGRKNRLKPTQEQLAKTAHCSRSTVQQAIAQLVELGYLYTFRQWRYSATLDRLVYAANGYVLRHNNLDEGYTLVPYGILGAQITHSTFAVLVRGYRYSGRVGRFYASLRHMAKVNDFSKATINRAIAQLRQQQLLVRLHCIRVNRSFSCNSYYPTSMVLAQKAKTSAPHVGDGLIFGQPLVINKITRDFIKRDKIYGVAQFGDMHKNLPYWDDDQAFYFDGVGVRVYAIDEQVFAT